MRIGHTWSGLRRISHGPRFVGLQEPATFRSLRRQTGFASASRRSSRNLSRNIFLLGDRGANSVTHRELDAAIGLLPSRVKARWPGRNYVFFESHPSIILALARCI